MATKKAQPSWSDVKAQLAVCDRAGLLALVQDLYAASKDNQAFLHARLSLGNDVPDLFKNQDTSVVKAKKAIADYKKASGTADGLAELMVFYCERASGFSVDVGMDDESYLSALARMFEQAMTAVTALPEAQRMALWARLALVHERSRHIGYGVGDHIHAVMAAQRGR